MIQAADLLPTLLDLAGVDLDVEQGKTTVLVGRTGAGKTSLLLLCTGLIPQSLRGALGSVKSDGNPWNGKREDRNKWAEALGFEFDFQPGPVLSDPVRTPADIDRIRSEDPEERLPFVYEAIRLLRRELEGLSAAPREPEKLLRSAQGDGSLQLRQSAEEQ